MLEKNEKMRMASIAKTLFTQCDMGGVTGFDTL